LDNAINRFVRELEETLSDIAFSGFKNIHPGILEKLSLLGGSAKELGMDCGSALLTAFAEALRNYRTTAGGHSVPAELLCRLDFYNKNLMGNMDDD
jgi:hypothetical protein